MNKNAKNKSVDKDELLLAEAFLKHNFDRIIDWTVGDIRKCCRMSQDGTCDKNGALVGAFILWCCAIDYFGGLYSNNPSKGGTKSRIKSFIGAYMKNYDYKLVNNLRWSLLHYYSPHHFILYHENSLEINKNLHLQKRKGGIMLHLGWAIKNLEEAVQEYKKDLGENDFLKINAWRYYKKQFPIMPVKIENVVKTQTFTSLATGLATGTSVIRPIIASGTIGQDYWFKK